MATTANQTAAAVATSGNVGRWARELAKAASAPETKAGARFYGIALALIDAAPAKGATGRITFAAINAATGKKRGEGAANPRAAWVRALSAVGDLHGAAPVAGVLTLELHDGRKLAVSIADDDKAYTLRTL